MTVEIKCDGEHPGFSGGELSDGDEVYCDECVTELRDKIEELEKELELMTTNYEDAECRASQLEEQTEQLQNDLNEKTLANG